MDEFEDEEEEEEKEPAAAAPVTNADKKKKQAPLAAAVEESLKKRKRGLSDGTGTDAGAKHVKQDADAADATGQYIVDQATGKATMELMCKGSEGRIIGKGGETIRYIEARFKVKVDMKRDRGTCFITGPVEIMVEARRVVTEIIEKGFDVRDLDDGSGGGGGGGVGMLRFISLGVVGRLVCFVLGVVFGVAALHVVFTRVGEGVVHHRRLVFDYQPCAPLLHQTNHALVRQTLSGFGPGGGGGGREVRGRRRQALLHQTLPYLVRSGVEGQAAEHRGGELVQYPDKGVPTCVALLPPLSFFAIFTAFLTLLAVLRGDAKMVKHIRRRAAAQRRHLGHGGSQRGGDGKLQKVRPGVELVGAQRHVQAVGAGHAASLV
mmetsp:Transcript_10655/g.26110  ORF Transcript_10655/g.26110 Transcript_10655/m.26110 type:complete len:377 (-) Transcript_10655:2765-3895(-)